MSEESRSLLKDAFNIAISDFFVLLCILRQLNRMMHSLRLAVTAGDFVSIHSPNDRFWGRLNNSPQRRLFRGINHFEDGFFMSKMKNYHLSIVGCGNVSSSSSTDKIMICVTSYCFLVWYRCTLVQFCCRTSISCFSRVSTSLNYRQLWELNEVNNIYAYNTNLSALLISERNAFYCRSLCSPLPSHIGVSRDQ